MGLKYIYVKSKEMENKRSLVFILQVKETWNLK